jgi:predicted RNA polymerase sigma factor
LARRAFYAGDYAGALEQLQSIQPEHDEVAQHSLLRAGSLRALDRTGEARAAFEQAAGASHHARFKSAALMLAMQAEGPFAADLGPWSIASSASSASSAPNPSEVP